MDVKFYALSAQFLDGVTLAEEGLNTLIAEDQAAAAAAEKCTANKEDDEYDFCDDMEDDDLFGDDGDDAEAAALAEKMAAAAKKKKKAAPKARSMIVLEVKPFDAETDLESLAQGIKKITHEGIQNWGQEHKLQPVAFGIKKLIISLVVFDDLIGVDDITDLLQDKFDDDIQSIDVAAFSKV